MTTIFKMTMTNKEHGRVLEYYNSTKQNVIAALLAHSRHERQVYRKEQMIEEMHVAELINALKGSMITLFETAVMDITIEKCKLD